MEEIKKIKKLKILKPRDFTIICKFEFVYYPRFWALLPAVNINIASNTLEFEWLCLALYIDFTIPKRDE